MTKGFIIDGSVVTEFIQVTLRKPNGVQRKRTTVTHKYLDGFLNEKSSSKITMKEFYEYYSRKEKAFSVIDEPNFISLTFEN